MGFEKIKEENKNIHDTTAALRFLELLHFEISNAKEIEDIRDEIILAKFQEYIDVLKKGLGVPS